MTKEEAVAHLEALIHTIGNGVEEVQTVARRYRDAAWDPQRVAPQCSSAVAAAVSVQRSIREKMRQISRMTDAECTQYLSMMIKDAESAADTMRQRFEFIVRSYS